MNFSKVVNFVLYILCTDGKHWYSVTDNSDIQEKNHIKTNFNFGNGKSRHYLPLITTGKAYSSRDEYLTGAEFRPSDPFQIGSLLKTNQTKQANSKKYSVPVVIRNKVENYNIVNMNRLKRKSTRRRCPRYRRKAKNSNSNATVARFLEVFEVVQFDHDFCTSSTGLEGTCLYEYECQNIGGASMGSCADGYGTCCVILFDCEGRSSAQMGWFNNPGFPSPSSDRLTCTFTLDKFSEDIKQIRLDLVHFELLPPTSGICELDQFLVMGQSVNHLVPILCGINTGQHVYIEVTEGPLILSMQTVTAENRIFSIKITQIAPSDDLAAPTGCLQFFKTDHGHIESFNYRERSEIGITRIPSYLNNLNYAMCIERAPASCSVTYTNVEEMQIVNYDTEGLPVIPPQQAGVEILNCPSDWLLIAALRMCGERLNDGSVIQDFSLDAPVTDDGAGPIVVWFRSDSVYTGRGFRLYYQQNSCTT